MRNNYGQVTYNVSKGVAIMVRITVSFKNTTRDLRLFKEVDNKEKTEKSEFVKDAIEFYVEYLKTIKKE